MNDRSYTTITRQDDLGAVAQAIASSEVCSLDIETTSLHPRDGQIRLLQVEYGNGPVIIDLFQTGGLGPLEQALREYRGIVVGANLKFEQGWLYDKYDRLEIAHPFDVMVASRMISNGLDADWGPARRIRHDYWSILQRELGLAPRTADEQKSKWSSPNLTISQLDYAADDVREGRLLREKLREKILKAGLSKAFLIEMRALLPAAAIECEGMPMNQERWRDLAAKKSQEAHDLSNQVKHLFSNSRGQIDLFSGETDINLNSPSQVLEALRERGLNLPSSGKAALLLSDTDDPVVRKLLEYRKAAKQAGTYGEMFLRHVSPVTGRLHTDLYALTDTGRYSSRDPNLQNIPNKPEYRRCFEAPEGWLLSIGDYSQIELRLTGILAKDPIIRDVYLRNEDVYLRVASMILGIPYEAVTKAQRQVSKIIALALAFGMGTAKLARQAKTDYGLDLSVEQADAYKAKYLSGFRGIADWHNRVRNTDMKRGQTRTLSGWRRFHGKEAYCEYFNTPIQGSAAAGLKVGMRKLYEALRPYGKDARLTATVHDELHVESRAQLTPEIAKIQEQCMIEGMTEIVGDYIPISAPVDVGRDWGVKA